MKAKIATKENYMTKFQGIILENEHIISDIITKELKRLIYIQSLSTNPVQGFQLLIQLFKT